MIMKRAALALLLATLAALPACSPKSKLEPFDSMSGRKAASEARMATAASAAFAEGRTAEALAKYERLYKKQVGFDADVSLNYAQLLRKSGRSEEALKVLQPFVEKRRGKLRDNTDAVILNEYAAIKIALGDFERAEEVLNIVLQDKNAADVHGDTQNLMGVSLDARGRHTEAERMFRMALDGWRGDPTSVMNNLALCLSAQGAFDESLTILRKALIIAPKKEEIARNIEIIEALRDKVVRKAPVPAPAPAKKKKKS